MKKFLILVISLVFVCTAFAQDSGFVLPKGLVIALPANGAVKAEWVAPPLAESIVGKSVAGPQKFRMHPAGAVWVLNGQKAMADLASGIAFFLARPVNDFIFLSDGNVLLVSDNALSFLPPLNPDKIKAESPVLPFQPIVRLPAGKYSLASDGKDGVFLYGYDPDARAYAVFELLDGFAGWNKVFVSQERITAVSADSGVMHIACGRQVFRMRLGEKEGKLVFSHPLESVTGIAYQPGIGFFYATSSGIGLVAGASLEFMKCTAAQIMVKDNALYIFLPDSMGIMRLTNIGGLVSGQAKKKEQL